MSNRRRSRIETTFSGIMEDGVDGWDEDDDGQVGRLVVAAEQ